MSETTPAPWVYQYRNGNERTDGSNWGANGLWGADGSMILGDDGGWEGGFSPPNEADARLIEAAPDLLEACKKALTCQSNINSDVVALIRAAIDKAKGRNPRTSKNKGGK